MDQGFWALGICRFKLKEKTKTEEKRAQKENKIRNEIQDQPKEKGSSSSDHPGEMIYIFLSTHPIFVSL